jgi:hypothetical protein
MDVVAWRLLAWGVFSKSVQYVDSSPSDILVKLLIPCGAVVALIGFLIYALLIQKRSLNKQEDGMKVVHESIQLQRKSLRLAEHSAALNREQVRLLRKLAGEPPLEGGELQESAPEPPPTPPTQPPPVKS